MKRLYAITPLLLLLGSLVLPTSASAWCGQACFFDHNDCAKCGFAIYQTNVTCWSAGCYFCLQDYCSVDQVPAEEGLRLASNVLPGASAQACRVGEQTPATHAKRVVKVDVLAARS